MKFIDIPGQDEVVQEDIFASLASIIRRGDFILGEEVGIFEQEVAAYLGVRNAITVSSGTDALVLALKSLDLPSGSEVITTPFTFFATTEAIINAGLKAVYVDINPQTYNLDPTGLDKALTENTGAVLPVHLFGQPARMDAITKWAEGRGLFVVEDVAQAFGATLMGKKAGTWGELGAFSFYPTKNLGAYGDAGLVVTNNDERAERIKILRNQGAIAPYRHVMPGMNSRCDTLQAAVLRAKLPHVDKLNEKRRALAGIYCKELEDNESLVLPVTALDENHVFHQFTIQAPLRGRLQDFLQEADMPTAVYYDRPLHLQDATIDLGYKVGDFPNAESVAGKVLSLPIHPGLDEKDVRSITGRIKLFLSQMNNV